MRLLDSGPTEGAAGHHFQMVDRDIAMQAIGQTWTDGLSKNAPVRNGLCLKSDHLPQKSAVCLKSGSAQQNARLDNGTSGKWRGSLVDIVVVPGAVHDPPHVI